MKIAIPKERRAHEARVAASPETVKKLVDLGCEVTVEKGAGVAAAITDEAFKQAGATIAKDEKTALGKAAVVLKVQGPQADEMALLEQGAILVSILDPFRAGDEIEALAATGVTAFAMDLMPRITRAQSMDVLSSQANLAGYKAVLDAAAEFGQAFPMLMTAAGRINPARVLVMGAGVAGLQAIATARRLGAIVSATDVRPAAKEQVESLGASFVAVEDEEFKQAETAGGYAKEMSDEYKKKQAALIAETIPKQDIVITTALIPGRPAPKLISEDMVKSMKPGSVVVDLAVETGGNCELSEPGKVIAKHGVTIVGHLNVPSRLAADTSQLYARNLLNFLQTMIDKESHELAIDWEDELVKGTCVTRDGKIVHPALGEGS
jgi:NAD(P) transhydrogenase subunit alpha